MNEVNKNGKRFPRTLSHDLHPQEYFNPNNLLNKWFLSAAALTVTLLPTNANGTTREAESRYYDNRY